MPVEPEIKRAIVFVDSQNLFYAVKKAFGYSYSNYDIAGLASTICLKMNWQHGQTRFYTGIPSIDDKPFWHHFWSAKLAMMGGRQKIHVFSRTLRYRNQTILLSDGTTRTILVGQEKGEDVRIALNIVRLAREKQYDVALIFSQDQDLSEAAEEVRLIAAQQDRWIKLASAFPVSPAITDNRGINKTDWIKIDRKTYDSCIDPKDYRLKKQPELL